jgi:copper oxidase (laccase) domain-containing protein
VFKAVEPGPNNTALYVFVIDPAVKGADYAFWKTLYDSFPQEVQQLYRLYTAASAGGQSLLNLQLVQAFGSPTPPQ